MGEKLRCRPWRRGLGIRGALKSIEKIARSLETSVRSRGRVSRRPCKYLRAQSNWKPFLCIFLSPISPLDYPLGPPLTTWSACERCSPLRRLLRHDLPRLADFLVRRSIFATPSPTIGDRLQSVFRRRFDRGAEHELEASKRRTGAVLFFCEDCRVNAESGNCGLVNDKFPPDIRAELGFWAKPNDPLHSKHDRIRDSLCLPNVTKLPHGNWNITTRLRAT